jgi:hypothetical protein
METDIARLDADVLSLAVGICKFMSTITFLSTGSLFVTEYNPDRSLCVLSFFFRFGLTENQSLLKAWRIPLLVITPMACSRVTTPTAVHPPESSPLEATLFRPNALLQGPEIRKIVQTTRRFPVKSSRAPCDSTATAP